VLAQFPDTFELPPVPLHYEKEPDYMPRKAKQAATKPEPAPEPQVRKGPGGRKRLPVLVRYERLVRLELETYKELPLVHVKALALAIAHQMRPDLPELEVVVLAEPAALEIRVGA
jgi:hypothetical protein